MSRIRLRGSAQIDDFIQSMMSQSLLDSAGVSTTPSERHLSMVRLSKSTFVPKNLSQIKSIFLDLYTERKIESDLNHESRPNIFRDKTGISAYKYRQQVLAMASILLALQELRMRFLHYEDTLPRMVAQCIPIWSSTLTSLDLVFTTIDVSSFATILTSCLLLRDVRMGGFNLKEDGVEEWKDEWTLPLAEAFLNHPSLITFRFAAHEVIIYPQELGIDYVFDMMGTISSQTGQRTRLQILDLDNCSFDIDLSSI